MPHVTSWSAAVDLRVGVEPLRCGRGGALLRVGAEPLDRVERPVLAGCHHRRRVRLVALVLVGVVERPGGEEGGALLVPGDVQVGDRQVLLGHVTLELSLGGDPLELGLLLAQLLELRLVEVAGLAAGVAAPLLDEAVPADHQQGDDQDDRHHADDVLDDRPLRGVVPGLRTDLRDRVWPAGCSHVDSSVSFPLKGVREQGAAQLYNTKNS